MAYQRALYVVLLAARILFAVSPAYIHPDEYFQAPEVSASDIFGIDALRTWEFTGEAPVRSIIPIYLFSGTPQIIVRLIQYMLVLAGWQLELTPWLLFYANRVFMALLSYTIDICVVRAIRQQYPNTRLNATRFVLATSFCLAVFHTHTFANSFASVILAVCFDFLSTIECSARKHKSPKSLNRTCLLLGVALALGTFTHVSFPMFALPVALIAGLLLIRSAFYSGLLAIAAGGTLTSLALVVADSVYYGSIQLRLADGTLKITGSPTCTVLNNVLYNSNHDNLTIHGIHAWYNHMVISVPTLFGPLAILALAKGWTFIKSARMRRNTSYVSVAAALSAISGLAFLSLVPHQEPRFLIPMLPAIVICTWRWHWIAPAYFWHLWIAFNSVLSVLYGVVHQAGVIPAVVFISQTSVSPSVECRTLLHGDAVCVRVQAAHNATTSVRTKVLLFASYMAPRHLLAQPTNQGIVSGILASYQLRPTSSALCRPVPRTLSCRCIATRPT
ncbi:alpha 1,2 mannosyltransferase [Coemansia sp. RSA 370]|nr:alpha 1,2 mannosyltransferase [Coemansia sp. RSA 370]